MRTGEPAGHIRCCQSKETQHNEGAYVRAKQSKLLQQGRNGIQRPGQPGTRYSHNARMIG